METNTIGLDRFAVEEINKIREAKDNNKTSTMVLADMLYFIKHIDTSATAEDMAGAVIALKHLAEYYTLLEDLER